MAKKVFLERAATVLERRLQETYWRLYATKTELGESPSDSEMRLVEELKQLVREMDEPPAKAEESLMN